MPKDIGADLESMPEHLATSESEQMYLITVARAIEAGTQGPVAISNIAGALDVSVPSANEMIRKLDARGLVSYEPYRGVLLAEAGRRVATQVLRTRRLWATFLADHLGFSPAAADDQACHLEHVTSAEAANRLATFLGNPASGPLGRPIPTSPSAENRLPRRRLSDLAVGVKGEIVAVLAPDRVAAFLAGEGLVTGSRVKVAAAGSAGILVDAGGDMIHLEHPIAATVEVHEVTAPPGPRWGNG